MSAPDAARYPVAIVIALALMGAFFSILASLIEGGRIGAPTKHAPIVFKRLIHDVPAEPTRQKPTPIRLPPQVELSLPPMSFGLGADVLRPILPPIDVGAPVANPPIDEGPQPIYRPDPVYPWRLQLRGIEGWVQLKFDIEASGTVKHVAVVDADPKGPFDRAALRAVSQWKYEPMVSDGRPVARRNVGVVVRFVLEDLKGLSSIEDLRTSDP